MSNRSRYSSRRKRKATFYLVALLLLIALVFGVWFLVLDKDSPFNRRMSQSDSQASATPAATDAATPAPEETPSETEAPATPEPEAAATPTQEPLPTPTPEADTLAINNGSATAEPVGQATAVPMTEATAVPMTPATAAPTDAPRAAATPTAEPTAAATPSPSPVPTATPTPSPAPTATPEPTPAPSPTPRYYYPLPATRNPNGNNDTNEPTPPPPSGRLGDEPAEGQTPDASAAPEGEIIAQARVTLNSPGGKLNLRATPSTTGGILAELPNGTIVSVLSYEGDWAHVRVDDKEGYVSKTYLKEVEGVAALGLPYLIEVDRGMQVVRVYTIGADGDYSLLAREMICSTDSFGYKPPNGAYALNGEKLRWLYTFADSYAQYATRITGHILFHSIPYTAQRPSALNMEAYGALGTNASIGCVRLLCADAKWIYDNVPAGTVVRYVTGERDEAKLAELAAPPLVSGQWDPTDDNEDNPDYSPDYRNAHPFATPVPNVTPAPTAPWTPDTY